MSKSREKSGVGQPEFQIVFMFEDIETNDRAGETQDNEPRISGTSGATGSETETIDAQAGSQSRGKKARPAPGEKRKWYSLMDKVYDLANLQRAWGVVAANRGACGMDGITIQQYAHNAQERLEELSVDLKRKTYRPQAVRRVYIPKSGGGKRPLGIPTVRDRIVQQALLQILSPIFENTFSKRSHGFRPERGCASALKVVDEAVRHKYTWVVDADIQSFFDTVDHEKLLAAVHEEVTDGSILRLVRQILRAGVIQPATAEVEPTERGTPQGGPLSPLLANIYLHPFDKKMEQGRYGLVRYADDFVIFTKSESEAQTALALAQEMLEGELGLTMHPEKTRIVTVDEGFEFLGFHYYRDPKSGMHRKEVRQKSANNFRENIRKRTPRIKNQRKPKPREITAKRLAENQRLQGIIRDLNLFLRGWHWYFKAVWSPYQQTPHRNFDGYVRARIRMALTGRVGAGWWHSRIPIRLLQHLGLLSLDTLQSEYLQGQLSTPARKG